MDNKASAQTNKATVATPTASSTATKKRSLLDLLPFGKKKASTPGSDLPGQAASSASGQTQEQISSFNLKDLLAPNYLEVDFNHVRVNDTYYAVLLVTDYPRQVSPSWLEPLINFEKSLSISSFYYPVDSDLILKNLKKKIAELEASLSTEHASGRIMDPKAKVAYQDAQQLLDKIASGQEKFFNFALYIRISAKDLKQLENTRKNVTSTLAAIGLTAVPATLRMEQGLQSTLPYGADKIYQTRNMDSTSLATTFPFVSSELAMDKGILYGMNMHNKSLIVFDRFFMPNANSVIFATSGAGKSYAVKLEALRSLMLGTHIIIIDPENEFQRLCEAVDGSYITFSQDSNDKINPFEFIRNPLQEDKKRNVLRDKILSLHSFFKIMYDKLTNVEEAILDKALILTYREKGITTDPQTWNNPVPLLEDLYKILKGMAEKEAQGLASRIEKYVAGSAAGVFNEKTTIDLNNHFTVFSIRDLQEDLRPLGMHMVLDFIWTKIREERRRRLLIIDEAWIMMQHRDSARFIFSVAKRARKYYLGLTTISQDVDEFLTSRYGQAVVNNSSIQMLLKQSPAAIDKIQNTFNLSSGERHFLLSCNVGEGLFFAGLNHVAIKVIASEGEHQLITSDPRELEMMAKKNIQPAAGDIDELSRVHE